MTLHLKSHNFRIRRYKYEVEKKNIREATSE